MGWADLAATQLENEHVLLRPVRAEDRAFFDASLADAEAGRRVVYHITDKSTDRATGSMSFCNMAEPDGRLEIGWSWLGRDFQGKGVNRWAKFLMLPRSRREAAT